MKTTKPKPKPTHPTYAVMIKEAIVTLKERTGSSRPALQKFIKAKYKLPDGWEKKLSLYLKKMTMTGALVQVKASWKLGEKLKKESKAKAKPTAKAKAPAKKAVTKKPAAKSKVKKPPTKSKSGVQKTTAKGKKIVQKRSTGKKSAPKQPKRRATKPTKK